MPFVYRFLDECGNVLYVGKTKNISARMHQHFGGSGHLGEDNYGKVAKVECVWYETDNDVGIIERALIAMWKPKFNTEYTASGLTIKVEIPLEKEWREYNLKGRGILLGTQTNDIPKTQVEKEPTIRLKRLDEYEEVGEDWIGYKTIDGILAELDDYINEHTTERRHNLRGRLNKQDEKTCIKLAIALINATDIDELEDLPTRKMISATVQYELSKRLSTCMNYDDFLRETGLRRDGRGVLKYCPMHGIKKDCCDREVFDERYCFAGERTDEPVELLTLSEKDELSIRKLIEHYELDKGKKVKVDSCALRGILEDAVGFYVSNADCKKVMEENRYNIFKNNPQNWWIMVSEKGYTALQKRINDIQHPGGDAAHYIHKWENKVKQMDIGRKEK